MAERIGYTVVQVSRIRRRFAEAGMTHWTTRDLARKTGVSHTTVHRLWRAHALKPHRVTTFKFTTDPAAKEKIRDVIGLSLHPPTFISPRRVPRG